jgi:hypothetical protein
LLLAKCDLDSNKGPRLQIAHRVVEFDGEWVNRLDINSGFRHAFTLRMGNRNVIHRVLNVELFQVGNAGLCPRDRMNRLRIIPGRWHRRLAKSLRVTRSSGIDELRMIQVLFSTTGGGGPPIFTLQSQTD